MSTSTESRAHCPPLLGLLRLVPLTGLLLVLLPAFSAGLTPESIFQRKADIYHDGWIDLNKNGRMDPYENPALPVEQRIDDLLARMNVNEKTCQMATLYGYGRVLTDQLPTPKWKQEIWKDGIANIDEHLNGFGGGKNHRVADSPYCSPPSIHAAALNEVQRFFIEDTRLGIPVDFTDEGIRGVEAVGATDFPTELGIGHTWDPDLVRQIGEITGSEARAYGFTNVYAPILDVGRDPRWGRMEEVYGESPYLAARLGVEMVRGMQSQGIASTLKHFAIYSNNKGAREGMARVDPQCGPRETEMIHLFPFRRVITEADPLGVMCSYNDYDGVPIEGSAYYLTQKLRQEYGFHGYVVSDSGAVKYLYIKHHVAANYKEAVRQSVQAGLNVRCTFSSPAVFIQPLRELIRDGELSMDTIDSRVRDVLRVKFMLGLFDKPYVETYAESDRLVNNAAHRAVALRASRECLVLLKNDGKLLPLDRKAIKTIAVCGPNADEKSYALQHYGPHGVEVTTVLEGIRAAVEPGTRVLYSKGCDLVDAHWPESEILPEPMTREEKAGIREAATNARRADVAVVVVGGGTRTCGENKSRTSLDLPGRQLDLVKAIQNTGTPTVVVLINGRPLSINWTARYVPAILEAWYPGSEGGTAVAEALFGDIDPGGKLTVTFPKTVGQLEMNFPAKPFSQVDNNSPGHARVNGVLFPFGYGLSYTTFQYSNIRISPETQNKDGNIVVTFDVENTGTRPGDEIAQLYIRDLVSSVTTYEKNLRGFERIHLEPGERRSVTMTVKPDDLALVDLNRHHVVEPGEFKVMVGASSEDIRLQGTFEIVP